MKRIEAEICLPLFSQGKITGLIVLGKKLSGDYYSKEDLTLLQTLANQVSLAVENAKLYSRLKSFNYTLKQKVNEATKELREANVHLKKLDKAKSDERISLYGDGTS